MSNFTTRTDAVQTLIVDAIEAGDVTDAHAEFDVEAIADAVLVAGPRGFEQAVDADEFWAIVEANAR